MPAVSEPNPRPADPAPYTPPGWAVLSLLLLALGGAGFFVSEGLHAAGEADERLAATLLEVVPRSGAPIDFELKDMSGRPVKLSSFRGKTVFLNFWATWCPPCVEEMPSMRRLYANLADHPDFVFLAVSTDEGWDEVRAFFEKEPAPFPVLLDAGGTVARAYGTTKFPETYVIRDGKLLGHIIGPRDWDRWFAEDWLREVLGPVAAQ